MSAPALPSARSLRLAVAGFRMGEPRRTCPPSVHAGVPGRLTELEVGFEEGRRCRLDADLRIEIAAALLSRSLTLTPAPTMWLTRPGELTAHDTDLAWLAASTLAAAEVGLEVAFVVITRRGWYDPRTGAGQQWVRLRLA